MLIFENTISVNLLSIFYGAMEIERHPELLWQQLLSKAWNVLWCQSRETTHPILLWRGIKLTLPNDSSSDHYCSCLNPRVSQLVFSSGVKHLGQSSEAISMWLKYPQRGQSSSHYGRGFLSAD